MAGITLGISIAAYPVLRQHTQRLALCLIALATANAPLQAVESAMLLLMFSLSHQSAMAGAGDGPALQIVATALGSTRRWVHYTQLVMVVSWIVVLYTALWHAAMIPPLLAVTGLITSGLQLAGVPLPALLGYRLVPEMAMPLAPAYPLVGRVADRQGVLRSTGSRMTRRLDAQAARRLARIGGAFISPSSPSARTSLESSARSSAP